MRTFLLILAVLFLNLTIATARQQTQTQTQTDSQTQTNAAGKGSDLFAVSDSSIRAVEGSAKTQLPAALHLQVLLDRAGFSPGEIDGRLGKNTTKAIAAYQEYRRQPVTGKADERLAESLQAATIKPVVEYRISESDAGGPFVESLPDDMMEQAELPSLSYTSPLEALAEKFHCSAFLLKALNRGKKFETGEWIVVPNVYETASVAKEKNGTTTKKNGQVTVVVSQSNSDLVIHDASGQVLFFAPATAGSTKDPLPLGKWKVMGIARDPEFQYNPELFWDADPSHAKAKVAAGPNNPVGVVWIEINAEHYGIHGTPSPGGIGYKQSHGCVRLTNWDALRVAELVKYGTEVVFKE